MAYIPFSNWFATWNIGITEKTKWLKGKPFLFQYKKIIILSIMLLFVLLSCSKKEPSDQAPQKADSLSNAHQDVLVPADAPAWYITKPETQGYLYGRGMARSRRVNIARDKAILKAQAELAELLNSDSTLTVPVELKNTLIKEKKQIKEGKQWRVYVLLEAPLQKE